MKRSYILRYLQEKGLLFEGEQLIILRGFSPYSIEVVKKEIDYIEQKNLGEINFNRDKIAFIVYEELSESESDSVIRNLVPENTQILLVNNIIPYDKIALCANIVSANFVDKEEEMINKESIVESEVFKLLSGLINLNKVANFPQINLIDPLSIPYQNFVDCSPSIIDRPENEYEVKLSSRDIVDYIFSNTKREAKEIFCKKYKLPQEEYLHKLSAFLKSTSHSRTFNIIMNKTVFLLDLKKVLERKKADDLKKKKSVLSTKLKKELEDLKKEKNNLLEEFPTSDNSKQDRLKFINLRIEVIENKYSKEFKNLFSQSDNEIILINEGLEYLFLVARKYLPKLKLTPRDFHPYNAHQINNMFSYPYRVDIYKGLKKATEQINDSL